MVILQSDITDWNLHPRRFLIALAQQLTQIVFVIPSLLFQEPGRFILT